MLVCALVIAIAVVGLPWLALEDESTVTVYDLIADTEDELDVPARITNTFLVIIPVAAVAAAGLAVWALVAPRHDRTLSTLILLVGLMLVGYYYGTFLYEDHVNDSTSATEFVRSGFFVALVAGLGLIAQAAIPHAGPQVAARPAPVKPAGPVELPQNWRLPFAWTRARLAPLTRRLGAYLQLSRIPVLAYLIGLLAATELERREGEEFARLLGFRRMPSLFGSTELLEPFSNLDFSGILAPFFPAPTDNFDAPLRASWEALRQLGEDFVYALTTHGPREPGFLKVLLHVVEFDLILFILPLLVVALVLRKPSNTLLLKLPTWAGLTLQIVVLYGVVSRWGALNDYRELVLIYMGVNIMLADQPEPGQRLHGRVFGRPCRVHGGRRVCRLDPDHVAVHRRARVRGCGVVRAGLGAADRLPRRADRRRRGGGVGRAAGRVSVLPHARRLPGDRDPGRQLHRDGGHQQHRGHRRAARPERGAAVDQPALDVLLTIVLSVIAIHNLVCSTFGKGIVAIREDEIAAELMGVNTRRVKLVAFMVSSFIAGMAGGLFAHVLAYVNPGVFGILKSTEALVMVYLGGMGSITGSIDRRRAVHDPDRSVPPAGRVEMGGHPADPDPADALPPAGAVWLPRDQRSI